MQTIRVGIGFDLHRLKAAPSGGTIPLGGVAIPCPYEVEAHSDGDVLLHALVDACLGALALGDIGRWFPDTDERFRGKPSSHFVLVVRSALTERGYSVAQIDANILAERPKISPHADAIRGRIAELTGTGIDSVSVKAKTMEGVGPIGEKKAIAAQVVVVLEKSSQ